MISDKRIRELEFLAFHDDMTKLYNRQYLFREIKISNFVFLYFIDINNLKKVNDKLGYFSGDEHIRKIVRNIKGLLSKNDIFLRYAGDEFLVLSNDDNLLISTDLYSVGKAKTNSKIRPTIKKANKDLLKNKNFFI